MGDEEEKFSGLIGKIYETALHQDPWPDLLKDLAGYMRSQASIFRVSDVSSNQVYMGFTHGHDETYLSSYRDHYIHIDPFRPLLKEYPSGVFYPGQVGIPYAKLAKTEFYNDMLVRNGLHYTLGGYAMRDGSLAYQMVVQRGDITGDYSDEEIAGFNRLIPHLQRAFKINQHMSSLLRHRELAEQSLGLLSTGVILCGEEGEVIYLNKKAEEILAGKNGLRLVSGKLAAKSQRDSGRLQQMIRNALCRGNGSGTCSGSAYTLQRESGSRRPLPILVTPLSINTQQRLSFVYHRPCAAVFIGSPAQSGRVDPRLVGALFGLTAAEARLASELAKGKCLEEICDLHQISYHTGRSQLRSVFSKAGVTRQTELVNLILTSPAAL